MSNADNSTFQKNLVLNEKYTIEGKSFYQGILYGIRNDLLAINSWIIIFNGSHLDTYPSTGTITLQNKLTNFILRPGHRSKQNLYVICYFI